MERRSGPQGGRSGRGGPPGRKPFRSSHRSRDYEETELKEPPKKPKGKPRPNYKIFNRWSAEGIVVNDPGIVDYIDLLPDRFGRATGIRPYVKYQCQQVEPVQ